MAHIAAKIAGLKTATFVVATESNKLEAEFDLKQFWNLEGIGIAPESELSDDDKAHEAFQKSVTFEGGRYVVSWPWRSDPTQLDLQEDWGLAYGRLRSLLRRLSKQPELLEKYDSTMKEQATNGIVEMVVQDQPSLVRRVLSIVLSDPTNLQPRYALSMMHQRSPVVQQAV